MQGHGEERERRPQLGRRARKALATRQAMFEAGLAAFEHRPLGMVSVLDITEASDVAKGVFYLHFRGKDEYLIALWEAVQRAFLDSLRKRLEACHSHRARTQGVVSHYHGLLQDAPRECRFWLRMSSYFGDEIGQPGHLHHLRQDHLRQLGALIAGATHEAVGERELLTAAILDGACWGLISQAIHHGVAALEKESFVRVASSALRSG